ncbi:MAG: hypothetical protein M5U26_06300 [Planctomycetota bacterium]|nr:hypothetical protein [Planctomycetota bacterium]
MPLGTHDGYQLLIVGEVKSAAELLREAWKTPKTELTVSWAGAPGQEAAVCLGPDQDHIVVLRQKAKVADFAAALQVTPWGAPVEKLRKLEDGGPGLAGAAFEKDGAETRVYVAHAAGAWKAGGFESDARVLVARLKDGKLERLVWSGGASAAFGGSTWTLEKPGNGHVAGENGELKLVGSWMP